MVVARGNPRWSRVEGGVVRADDLKGAVFAYNDKESMSGLHCVRGWLAAKGLPASYFERAVATGGHRRSIEQLLSGRAHVAAIDMNVLRRVRKEEPEVAARLMTVTDVQLGPYTCQPLVASTRLPQAVIDDVRTALTSAHEAAAKQSEPKLQAVAVQMLDALHATGFAALQDEDYDDVRDLMKASAGIDLADPAEASRTFDSCCSSVGCVRSRGGAGGAP